MSHLPFVATVGNSWSKPVARGAKLRGSPNKFNAVATVVDNIRFSSKKEAERYKQLRILQNVGQISELVLQPNFRLEIDDMLICIYRADFKYKDRAGNLHVEDVKGFQRSRAFDLFRIKAKLMLALYGILVETI